MMDTKKRPLVDDQEMGIAKKRAVASITGSPIAVNGKIDVVAEELNADNLESFRKVAIFRRMREYSREHERAQEQIMELESRRKTLEANVAVIEACWGQIVQEVKSLVKPEALPAIDDLMGVDHSLFDLANDADSSSTASALSEVLRDRGLATQTLVAAFVHLGPKAAPPDGDQLRRQCSKLQAQVSVLHAELETVRSRAEKAENEKDRYHAGLMAAEARADREHLASMQAMRSHSLVPEKEESKPVAMSEVKEEEAEVKVLQSPSPAAHEQSPLNGQSTPTISEDQQDWKALYDICDKRNREMTEELLQLKARCNDLSSELASPSMEMIQKTPCFEVFRQQAQYHRMDAESSKLKCLELMQQVAELRESREDFKERMSADFHVKYDEQKSMLLKRDQENVRLREQRDALSSELNEVRSRAAEKKSIAQFQILLQSRADRIAALELESKRLKSHLAANAGQEGLFELILGDKLKDLPERLHDLQRKVEALETSLASLDSSHPDVARHIRSESETREAYAAALSRLERFDSIFGPGSALPSDQQATANQLRDKDELLRIANLQRQQAQVASNDLFSEIERLSAAWESLDRQNKTKIFDLEAMEAKVSKANGDKAKADNKYFSAMRQKEAAEAERKAVTRTVEKLQKTVERFTEAEKGFTSKLTSQEREMSLHRTRCHTHEDILSASERKLSEEQLRVQALQKQLAEYKRLLVDAQSQGERHRFEARRFEEEGIRARREADRQAAKANAVSSGKVTTREMDLEQKYDKCMKLLRCSTCKQNLRSHVLSKCMHSFCKECIQARIDTRQRKCPACNMGFSQSEFQQLYFQG